METRRRIKHKREEEDQIEAVSKEDQAKKDLELMRKLLLNALFARRITMIVVVVGLENVLVVTIQITW